MTSPEESGYSSPAAMRRALTDKLRDHAYPRGTWPLTDLQRQFAFDRLLTRLYRVDSGWVIKGATALLARGIAVRHTIDLDVYRSGAVAEAERHARAAAGLDLGDWVRFEVDAATAVEVGAAGGLRLPARCFIGTTRWAAFHVDLVGDGTRMTGSPDDVSSLTSITLPGGDRVSYRAYPLVDHVADKTCAILQRYGTGRRPSTRYKDLVDLVALLTSSVVSATEQRRALLSEAGRRGIQLPVRFGVPDRGLWEPGYRAEAGRARHLHASTLDDALGVVSPFLDPLLAETAIGMWDPRGGRWHGFDRLS